LSGRTESKERGNAVVAVLVILVLLGFGALVLDIGYLRFVRAELQNATDAAALSGAGELNLKEEGLTAAVATAVTIGEANPVNGGAAGFVAEDVTLGIWADGAFTPSADPLKVNAVYVGKQVGDVKTVLAPVAFGASTLVAGAESYAALPPPEPATEAECFLPLAIPDCRFASETPPEDIMRIIFQMTGANADNAAWALPQTDNPSDSAVVDVIHDGCQEGEDPMEEGRVSLNSGAMANAFRELAQEVNASGTAWNAEKWGALPAQLDRSLITDYGNHVIEGAIMMFEPPAGYCTDANNDGFPDGGGFIEDDMKITGLAWAVVFDVKGQGGGGQVCTGTGRDRVCVDDTSAGNIQLVLDLDYDGTIGTGGGGGYDGGVMFQGPATIVIP
jgi:hypothetical protein